MQIEKLQYIKRHEKRFWLLITSWKDHQGNKMETHAGLDALAMTFDTRENAIAYFNASPYYQVAHILDTETREAWEVKKD